MKIIYIHQHFMTNRGFGGTRSYDVAKYMVKAGHQVHMITGIYDTSGLEPMGWYQLFRKENLDGIDVTVCNVPYSNEYSSIRRMWAFLWFAFLATIAALSLRKIHLVFATSTPLTVGIAGYIAAIFKRVPFVFEVRDLWPESFIRSGWVKGTEIYIRLMGKLEVFLYNHADKILLVSPGFEKRLIERGFPADKLKTILLGADGNLFRQVTPDHSFLAKYNIQDKTIAIYTGAHGKANGLDYIIEAAKFSQDHPDIMYVLIGQGGQKRRLEDRACNEKLMNVVFADAVPKEQLAGILAVCQIGLMILKDINEPRPVTPNKIFDYMFMAMPSLVNFQGPTIDMVDQIGCGLYVDPKEPRQLAQAVKKLATDSTLCHNMGQRGKQAAWKQYDRKIIANQLMEVFDEVVLDFSNRKKR